MKRFSDLFKIKWLKIDLVGTVFHFKNKILQKCFNVDLGPNYFFSPQFSCSRATVGTTSLSLSSGPEGLTLLGGVYSEVSGCLRFASPLWTIPGASFNSDPNLEFLFNSLIFPQVDAGPCLDSGLW